MLFGGLSASINFLLITPFITLLNSSINGLPSYPLHLAALLNSCMNSSIILPSYFNFFNFVAFTDSSSSPQNSFLIAVKNFPTDSYSITPSSKSSKTFSFQISADPLCTNNNTHYTCSSTIASLIFILRYNLHAVTNSPTLPASLLKIGGLATSMWDLL